MLLSHDEVGLEGSVKTNDLTTDERALIQELPKPPVTAKIRATNVLIVEWLPSNEQHTGRLLYEWMNDRRPGWSVYFMCRTKNEVIITIERAAIRAQQTGIIPVLHLEAHGGDLGLEGPDGAGGVELLSWDELTDPLQRLNLVTRCNLIVVVAACTGFAGILAFRRGPRAPAIALVGPDAIVLPSSLLSGTKELYRRWMDENPNLREIAINASQQAGTITFEVEPFVLLAYEATLRSINSSVCADPAARPMQCRPAYMPWPVAQLNHNALTPRSATCR